MAINEQIVTGRKFRKLMDEANKIWQRISFWTKASDVEFNDGKNAETKLGAINGITSDLNCDDPTIAASAKSVRTLNTTITNMSTTFNANLNNKANASALGTQCIFSLSGTTLTITPK
ncbi:MAG: hypothetical protein HFI33_13425 [Lachnospiraceae bacterium]|nr:hypothetical protein [Lachnospiraceae bacterium]